MASAGTLSSACLYCLWLRKHVISCCKWTTPPGPELQLYLSELAVFFLNWNFPGIKQFSCNIDGLHP